jgi:hypothetical protein
VSAPLPPVSTGTQTVRRGIAGNLQTDDGRAIVTWQPGAVPVGKTVSLTDFSGSLALPNSEVSLSVPGLGSKGFRWPLDVMYAQQQPPRTVLGYSTNGRVYNPVPSLQPAVLPTGTAVGWYVDGNNLTHVLTRTPFALSLFRQGAWGDPTYTAPTGPALAVSTPFKAFHHPADRTLLLSTQLAVHSQARMTAFVTGPHGVKIPIIGKGSRFGSLLRAGTFQVAQTYRRKPGQVQVRLRLGTQALLPGVYSLRVAAVDPWGRHSRLTFHFHPH